MTSSDELVEQWFEQTIDSYPALMRGFLKAEQDPFRNPVGHMLRGNLECLLREILGDMDLARVSSAIETILRLRVVQDFTPSQAVGFVFLLRPILRGTNPARPAMIEARIDQLALAAFDQYMKCREQLAEVRARESLRRVRVRSVCRS